MSNIENLYGCIGANNFIFYIKQNKNNSDLNKVSLKFLVWH